MAIKAVIFDMDGVLIDSMKYHIYSWYNAFKKFNLKTNEKELALYEGISFKKTIEIISKKNKINLNQAEKEKIHSEKKKILTEVFNLEPYDGMFDFLHNLKKRKLQLAVVTGCNKAFASKILNAHFNGIFNAIVTGDDTKNGKPSPEPYLKALEFLNINSNQATVVENAPSGIESAKKAKIKTYALTTTLSKQHLAKADKTFKTHNELFDQINDDLND